MRRSTLTWGAILILLGALLLLDNLNIINVNIWGLFWPLLLIWFGVQILLRPRWAGRSAETEHVAIPLKGVEEARVQVNYGAGELHIHSHAAPDLLLEGSFGMGLEYDLRDGGQGVDLKMRPISGVFPWFPWWDLRKSRTWSFSLNNAIPLSLDVNTGASKAVLDLADLNVADLRIKTGASETSVTLPANAAYTKVRGDTGLAAVRFRVPEGVAARIRTTGGLSEINVNERRFPRSGGGYESADYAAAEHKVDIHLSVGLGSANID